MTANPTHPLDDDDLPIGRLLNRRELMLLLGGASAATLAACAPPATATPATAATTPAPPTTASSPSTLASPAPGAAVSSPQPVASPLAAAAPSMVVPTCVVRPQVTEGPYYVDVKQLRSDVRTDTATRVARQGAPLALTFQVGTVASSGCAVLPNAEVEIWHTDALGVYSGVNDPSGSTVGQNWLRGSQMTDVNGLATFTTIYPGWYPGRAVHIHFKVRPTPTTVLTSQLFFDEALSDQVFTQAPYNAKGRRNTLNSNDGIYNASLLLTVTQTAQGYAATFPIGIDLTTLGASQSGGSVPKPSGAPGVPKP